LENAAKSKDLIESKNINEKFINYLSTIKKNINQE